MALPKQVEQQMKELEELEKQLSAPQEEAQPEPETESAVEQPAAEVTPTQVVERNDEDVETWQQRYRTLKGMYDAEVPRLHAQLKELSGQMQYMQHQMDTSKQTPPSKAADKLVTERDVEAFGEDLIDAMRRAAREEMQGKFDSVVARLEQENAVLRQAVQSTGEQVNNLSFEQQLSLVVPDFHQINNDPRWVAWLNEFDPILRAPRRNAAMHAYNNDDAEGVAHYVNLFRQTLSTGKQDQRQAELERQVTPSRSASTAPVQDAKKSYTTTEVERMFGRIRELNAKGKLDEAAKLEAEIDAAYQQGRVRA
jgi:hypothetical protein